MRIRHLIALCVLAASAGMAFAGWPAAPRFSQATRRAQTLGVPLDINTATPRQLKALPGFGDAYVRRVIAGRPYTAKNQLVTRGVLPASAYARIAALIVAHRPVNRPAE